MQAAGQRTYAGQEARLVDVPADAGRNEFFVLPESWRSEVCAGLDPTAVARQLTAAGMLRTGKDCLQRKVRLPAIGQKKIYHLLPALLADDEAAQGD